MLKLLSYFALNKMQLKSITDLNTRPEILMLMKETLWVLHQTLFTWDHMSKPHLHNNNEVSKGSTQNPLAEP